MIFRFSHGGICFLVPLERISLGLSPAKVTPANAMTSMYRLKELPLESLSLFFWEGTWHDMGTPHIQPGFLLGLTDPFFRAEHLLLDPWVFVGSKGSGEVAVMRREMFQYPQDPKEETNKHTKTACFFDSLLRICPTLKANPSFKFKISL